ncbi:hypothetical protein HEK616_09700 [Streptomyces nigrescens]|uniref:Uncharacterized protein n=1 Tax=Streptomyces nigrescens TaxID=1920 RepID=A0ABM7ZMY3_STRNI|nr:hypothetical protein HEK616_09700 [Streptomyces nigrescens]
MSESMSEVDERAIDEVAKGAPRVRRRAPGRAAAQDDAHRVVEVLAYMHRREQGGADGGDEP